MKVSIILPTYNESKGILALIKNLKQVFRPLKNNYDPEIIIVDDDSPDLTGKIVAETYKKDSSVKVFIRKKVRSLGTAIGYGIRKAKGEVIVGMDADGNHPPEKIPLMLERLKINDLVVGSRFVKDGGMENRFRNLGSLVFNFGLKILGFPIWDNTSGFYAISRKKLVSLNLGKIYYGYGDYHLRLVYLAKKNNYSIKEIPVFYKKRLEGESKSRLLRMFFDYFLEALRLLLKS